MTTNSTEARIREARLIVASPEQVFNELQKYAEDVKNEDWYDDEPLGKSLLARGDPLVDLGLARYARSTSVLSILYKKASLTAKDQLQERYRRGLKIAIFANEGAGMGSWPRFPESVIGADEFARVIAEDDEQELEALLSNPAIDPQFLESLYKNEGIAASIPDDRRRRLVHMTAYNPRLVTDESDEHGPDLGYMGIHEAIITMLATAPVTWNWLVTLRSLLEQLDPSNVRWPGEPITPILERWEKLPESESKLSRDGYYTALSFRDESLCLIAAMYGRHHARVGGSTLVVLGGPDAADVVLRCAYYGKAELTEQDMKAGFARDEDAYVLAVLCNDHIFYDQALLRLLESEHLRGNLRHIYRRRREQIHKQRPSFDPRPVSEWLIEGLPPEELPSKEVTMLEQLEANVAEVAKTITSMRTWFPWGFIIIGVLIISLRH